MRIIGSQEIDKIKGGKFVLGNPVYKNCFIPVFQIVLWHFPIYFSQLILNQRTSRNGGVYFKQQLFWVCSVRFVLFQSLYVFIIFREVVSDDWKLKVVWLREDQLELHKDNLKVSVVKMEWSWNKTRESLDKILHLNIFNSLQSGTP